MSFFKIFILNTLSFYIKLTKYKNNFLIDKILILLIRSNHPKRYLSVYEKLNIKINNNSIFYDKNNYQNLNIFIGDSHSEFYGRNYPELDDDRNLNLTYWIGPVLLMNFITSKEISKKIINFINFTTNKIKSKKINIILCFGEIDIRNSFYQILKIDKSFHSINALLSFIKKRLTNQITIIKNNINVKKYNLFFHDIQPTPNKQGINPKNKKELNKINNTNFPVLGNIKTRVFWRKRLENCLFKNQNKIGIKYIRQNSVIFDHKNNAINFKFTRDNNHTHDPVLLFDYQNKINEYKK
jgi:hypothetical protein